MAYENGDQIVDYLGRCLEKYEKDNTIFNKLSRMIDVYTKRADWPHSIEELEKSATNIIGTSIINLTFYVGRYIDDSYIKWDGVSDEFKKEYVYFYATMASIYNQAWFGRFNPNGYYGIAHTITHENKVFLKIIKNNGNNLEVEMSMGEIESLIYSLNNIIENKVDNPYGYSK